LGEAKSGAGVRKVRSAVFWRLLHGLLPLGQRLNAIMRCFIEPRGFVVVPWGRPWLTLDAGWLRVPSTASAPFYQGPRRQNPEFFALVAPMLAKAGQGAFVDVGANIGVYTLNARAAATMPIVAFEPEPAAFALLSRNTDGNDLPAVTIHNVACGDRPGILRLRSGINGAVAGDTPDADDADTDTIAVPVVRLDDALRGVSVAVIKIDCEGYEWQVLSGCREVIAAWRPGLFVELHPKLIGSYGHSLDEVCDLLRPDYNLDFWMFSPAPRRRLPRFLARYRVGLRPLPDEAAMLAVAARLPMPDQIFLRATPRTGRS